MSEHYYTGQPTTPHDRQQFTMTLKHISLHFTTDSGIFSKDSIDFGSRLLIDTMQIPPGAKVLDVGCGYGPIGLTAAKLHLDHHVQMIDINERAVQLASENARRNGIHNVTVYVSDLYNAVEDRDFDVILSNPPIRAGKHIVHAIFSGAVERLRIGGSLWIVIQKKQGAPSAFAKLQDLFAEVVEVRKDKGYRIFKATRKA